MANGKFVVGVIGTQNTGKSTFISDLIDRFKGTSIEFNKTDCDYRKKIEDAGLKINREGNFTCQRIIFDTLVEQIDAINGKDSGVWITDRTPIDAYVYTEYLRRHKPDAGVTDEALAEMFDRMKLAVRQYDRIIYLDLDRCGNVAVVDDKFRDTDLEYRMEIDDIFKDTIDRIGFAIMGSRLNSEIFGDREERIGKFLSLEYYRFCNIVRQEQSDIGEIKQ